MIDKIGRPCGGSLKKFTYLNELNFFAFPIITETAWTQNYSGVVGTGFFVQPKLSIGVAIDLSRFPMNKGTNVRLEVTKYSDLYEIFQPSFVLVSLCENV